MASALLLTVRFHDGRYHGKGDWPPSPARVFQSLVAAAARGDTLDAADCQALEWLERLPPPAIVAPPAREGQTLTLYVPNNDLDAKGGDPRQIADVRAAMTLRPMLFDASMPLCYRWLANDDSVHAARVAGIAHRLFQLGRGVDMAWAQADWLSAEEAEDRLASHAGHVLRPTAGSGVAVPQEGSLSSLRERHHAFRRRFNFVRNGRSTIQVFSQPPKARFATASYSKAPQRLVFDVLEGKGYYPIPLKRASDATASLTRAGAERLATALPDRRSEIERCVVGRGAGPADKATRLKLYPLPSTGHPDLIPAIRRFVAEIPLECSLPAPDVAWMLDSLSPVDEATGITTPWRLVRASDDSMLRRYSASARCWQSITAVALPQAPRRTLSGHERSKGAPERVVEEQAARTAVLTALRHANVTDAVRAIRVQREPFQRKGTRAEAFAESTRFSKHAMWHVMVSFAADVSGPLLLGDGRYCGLGVMEPALEREVNGVIVLALRQPSCLTSRVVTSALRRAMMSRVSNVKGRELPSFVSGHEADGTPLRRGRRAHVSVCFDSLRSRCLIIAPWRLEARRATADEGKHWRDLCKAMSNIELLRVSRSHSIAVCHARVSAEDILLAPARHWRSVTPYVPTRHAKGGDTETFIHDDVATECARRNLPTPDIDVVYTKCGSRGGLSCSLRLTFPRVVPGPIVLGRRSHTGGGLFERCADSGAE